MKRNINELGFLVMGTSSDASDLSLKPGIYRCWSTTTGTPYDRVPSKFPSGCHYMTIPIDGNAAIQVFYDLYEDAIYYRRKESASSELTEWKKVEFK